MKRMLTVRTVTMRSLRSTLKFTERSVLLTMIALDDSKQASTLNFVRSTDVTLAPAADSCLCDTPLGPEYCNTAVTPSADAVSDGADACSL